MNDGWVRPSACNGGGCPEVRVIGDRVAVRDSNRPDEVARFGPADFAALVAAVKRGEYDHYAEAAAADA